MLTENASRPSWLFMVNMSTPRQRHRTPAGQHRVKAALLEKAETPPASEVLMKTVKDFQK